MQQQTRVLPARHRRRQAPRTAAVTALAAVVVAVVVAVVITVTSAASRPQAPRVPAPQTQVPPAASVLSGTSEAQSAALARTLLASAPVVVVASPAAMKPAAAAAGRAHAPLLLWSPAASGGPAAASDVAAAVRQLRPSAVLAVGVPGASLAASLPRVRIVTSTADLPRTAPPPRALQRVAVLLRSSGAADSAALAAAIAVTARLAGARVISIAGADPRADPAAIAALAAARPQRVVGVGSLGTAAVLAAHVGVAETGVQLPGGGQVLFPGRTIVALYGAPATPALGALGQQGLTASISRARKAAGPFGSLSKVPVVPAFEIIATVATRSPGPGGTYSHVTSVAALRPWVQAAARAGLYVTLDLQPGRASLLDQAKIYQSLLQLPNVGLALDPEWKLQPGQLPLHQIGTVSISEVNSVADWLADLTARYRLPQKLLELHEFRPSMISGLSRLDTGHDDLAIVVNMDGQGSPGSKEGTWHTVVTGAPKGVYLGWKDFYVKDTPMLSPRATIRRSPAPVLISYQ